MIKIIVKKDALGSLILKPASDKHKKRIAEMNAYNGSYDVYLQYDHQINDFIERLTPAQRRAVKDASRYYDTCILMDDWTYRQMVGGMSD